MLDNQVSIKKILNARSIAVVGASTNPSKWGYMALKCLIDGGYKGDLCAVNPGTKEILGKPSYPTVREIPHDVDLLLVLIPAAKVAEALAEGIKKNAKGAVVISSGFREAGRKDLEQELMHVIEGTQLRIIGPNVQGINYIPNKMCAVFVPLITKRGPISIISQSGSVSATVSEWAERENVGITGMVNLGNQIDLCESDFLDFFAEDENTRVILLYLEGPKDGARFKKVLAGAALKKPVILLKPGRSSIGKKAASTHTGSIAGNDEIFTYACRQYGVIRASDIQSFYDYGKVFALQPLPKGKRVLLITTSGGAGAMTMDAVSDCGLVPVTLPESVIEELNANVTAYGGHYANPVDIPFSDSKNWKEVLGVLAKHDIADAVIFSIADGVERVEEAILDFDREIDIPIVVSYMGGGLLEKKAKDVLNGSGVPIFNTPEQAVKAFAGACWYSEFRRGAACRQ